MGSTRHYLLSILALQLIWATPVYATTPVNGVNSEGDVLPIGAGNVTVETITGSTKEADFAGALTAASLGVAGTGYFGGNLGVGTSTPLAGLDVAGLILSSEGVPTSHCDVDAENNILYRQPVGGFSFRQDGCLDTGMYSPSDGVIQFYTNANFAAQLTSSGLGIGTTNPIGTVDIENGANSATLCMNGSCVSSVGYKGCHLVTNKGAAPDYVSDARCASNEIAISGGGRAEIPGSDLCSGTSRGFIHYNAPDSDMKGWSVDAYNYDWSHDVCTEAYALCCPLN